MKLHILIIHFFVFYNSYSQFIYDDLNVGGSRTDLDFLIFKKQDSLIKNLKIKSVQVLKSQISEQQPYRVILKKHNKKGLIFSKSNQDNSFSYNSYFSYDQKKIKKVLFERGNGNTNLAYKLYYTSLVVMELFIKNNLIINTIP